MRFSGDDLRAILERRTTVRRERDLPDTGRALYAMNAQCRREHEWILLEGSDEPREHRQERPLQLARQSTKLAVEPSKPLERGHAYADGSTGKSSSLAATRSRCAANSSSRKIWPSVSRSTSERRSCSGRSSSEPSPRRSTSSYEPATPGSRSVILMGADATTEIVARRAALAVESSHPHASPSSTPRAAPGPLRRIASRRPRTSLDLR